MEQNRKPRNKASMNTFDKGSKNIQWREDSLFQFWIPHCVWVFPCGSADKESTSNAGDKGSIPGLGRSAGEGKG